MVWVFAANDADGAGDNELVMAVLNLTTGVVFLKSGALNFSGILTTNVDGSAVTSADGLVLQNGTAATSGVQVQISPRIRLRGTAWDSAASSTEDWVIENLPVAGASPTDSILRFARSVNGAANVTFMSLNSSTGVLTCAGSGGGNVGGLSIGPGASFTFASVGYFTGGGATGQFLLRDLAATEGIGFDVATDAILKIRNRAHNADASLGCSTIVQSGKTTKYNNITTAGWGTPAIQAQARSTAQTGAVGSVATYTVGAADGSFYVSANVLVTTATTHNFTVTCAYTDEGSTARTLTFTFSSLAGVLATAIINTGGAVPYEGVPMHIRCKTATAITIATTGTFTTVTYNVEGSITQIA